MINFDYKLLEELIKENRSYIEGATIRKVQQPSRQELVITMRNNGANKKFYVNINPQFFHISFMTEQSEKLRYIKYPQKPPMFCMLLRKYLENSKITKINQPPQERILELYIKAENETGEEIFICLAIELMGKHSNVILYNYDTNVIIGCMHNVGSEKSRERELFGGLPYIYPPKNKTVDFKGLSTLLSGYANEFTDNYFSKIQHEEKIKVTKNNEIIKIRNEIKKINAKLTKTSQQIKTPEEINLYRKKGDLIISNLYMLKDYQNRIILTDYETQKQIEIELDEQKSLKENAQRYYKLYNKNKKAREKQEEIVKELKQAKAEKEETLYFIEQARTLEEIQEISTESKVKRTGTGVIKVRECDIDGYRVYYGMNSRQNDYIVSKIGRKGDIWFHTRTCPGSHVLLRVESGQKVTDRIIYECAKLAKEKSAGKLSSKVGVIYTEFRNVKKPPGGVLGYVIYKGEKEIIID